MDESNIPGFAKLPLPHGFVLIKTAYRELVEPIFNWLTDPQRVPEIRYFSGRGSSISFKVNHPNIKRIFIKSYRRGSWRGFFLRDLYRGKRRFLKELSILEYAVSKNLPVPEPLALVLKRPFPGFYQAYLITREISAAQDLVYFLQQDHAFKKPLLPELINKIASTLVNFHNEGIYHPDLNLKNILVETSQFKIYLVDLDRAQIFASLSFALRMKSLIRLARSLVKLELDNKITKDIRLQFLKTYLAFIGKDSPEVIQVILRQCHNHIKWHKLWWKIFGK